MSEIVDIFNGQYLRTWRDEEFVYLSMPWVTINIPIGEELTALLEDLEGFLYAVKNPDG